MFEKVTKDELRNSISNGDKEKEQFMKNLILALPYHADEFSKIENLALTKATTIHPVIEPQISGDLKTLLNNHGLLKNNDKIGLEPLPILPINDYPLQGIGKLNLNQNDQNKRTAEIKPDSFINFKNIDVNQKNISTDVGNFLNQFGLLNSNNTEHDNSKPYKQKKSPTTKSKSSYLLPEFSDVLSDMGLQNPKFEALTSKLHGPDPIKESFKNDNRPKNEFKRQDENPTKVTFGLNDKPLLESSLESTDYSSTSRPSLNVIKTTIQSTTTTSTTTELSTTTEEEKKNNLEDEIDAIDEPIELPPPRRSGFYMILDWNSFLEVGEDPEKIIVRFDPKIGDPTRFLPVNVP